MDEKHKNMVRDFAEGLRLMRKNELSILKYYLGMIVPVALYNRAKKKNRPVTDPTEKDR